MKNLPRSALHHPPCPKIPPYDINSEKKNGTTKSFCIPQTVPSGGHMLYVPSRGHRTTKEMSLQFLLGVSMWQGLFGGGLIGSFRRGGGCFWHSSVPFHLALMGPFLLEQQVAFLWTSAIAPLSTWEGRGGRQNLSPSHLNTPMTWEASHHACVPDATLYLRARLVFFLRVLCSFVSWLKQLLNALIALRPLQTVFTFTRTNPKNAFAHLEHLATGFSYWHGSAFWKMYIKLKEIKGIHGKNDLLLFPFLCRTIK